MGAVCNGITLTGLKYTLTDGSLTPGFPLGVSNHFTGQPAGIRVKEGTVLCMWDRENGICPRE